MAEGDDNQPAKKVSDGTNTPPEDLSAADETDGFHKEFNQAIIGAGLPEKGAVAKANQPDGQSVQRDNGQLSGLVFDNAIYSTSFSKGAIPKKDGFTQSDRPLEEGLGKGKIEVVKVKPSANGQSDTASGESEAAKKKPVADAAAEVDPNSEAAKKKPAADAATEVDPNSEAAKKKPAADAAENNPNAAPEAKPEKTPAEKMLDPNTSNEDKIRIADEMYKQGQKSFKGPDGRKYEITEAKVGERRLVGVFTNDQNGHSKAVLRGIVEKDGAISQQQDSKGRKVDYESNWAKKTEGGGLRTPEKTADPKPPNTEQETRTEEQKRAALKPDADGIIRGVDEKDGSKFERKPDDKGGYVEVHTGEKPEQNYTKSDDGKGNILVNRKDGTGYSRTEQSPNGPFNEAHFGPKPTDFKTVRGDGKGNNVETTTDAEGGYSEKHTFTNAAKNFTRHTLPDQTVIEINDKGRTTTSGDGNTIKFEGKDGKGSTEVRSENGFVRTHTGPKPEDNWSVERKKDGKGGYSEEYKFSDSNKNYKKDVNADGKAVVTDSTGLQTELHKASEQFREKMLGEVQKIPVEERKRLADAGYKIAVVNKISDVAPSLANERPPGWPEGKTWNDVDGAHMANRKLVVVAENTNSGPSRRGEGVLKQGIGAAMNQAVGKYSESEDFKVAYQGDVTTMRTADRTKHSFLLQNGSVGREVTFANVYGAINGASSNPEQTQMVLKDFPRVANCIKRRLGRV